LERKPIHQVVSLTKARQDVRQEHTQGRPFAYRNPRKCPIAKVIHITGLALEARIYVGSATGVNGFVVTIVSYPLRCVQDIACVIFGKGVAILQQQGLLRLRIIRAPTAQVELRIRVVHDAKKTSVGIQMMLRRLRISIDLYWGLMNSNCNIFYTFLNECNES